MSRRVVALFNLSAVVAVLLWAGGAAASETFPRGWAQDGLIKFKVYRNENPLGVVMLRFDVKKDKYVVDTQTLFDYRVGPFTLYYYALRARDEWDGEGLVRAQGAVNDDGEVYLVDGKAEEAGFRFSGKEGEHLAPRASSVPSTYWNTALTDATKLIDLQYGRLRNIEMTEIGAETIEAEGRSVEAVHYEMRGDLDLDIWYDRRGEWVKMRFLHDGADFDYVRVAPRPGDEERFIELEAVRNVGAKDVRVVLQELE